MSKKILALDTSRPEVQGELKHLKEVLEHLANATMMMTGQKQSLTDALVDYRKQVIEENKFDEDKPLDSFDHEMFAREESYKAILRRLAEISELMDNPYFGKIRFMESSEKEEEIYIGKYGFIDEENYEPLIVDWRAPVASLFYHGSLGDASFKTPEGDRQANICNRRQFIIKNGELQGMFDSEKEIHDEILQYVLSSNAGEKLKDIVMTIQQEQDDIIRHDLKGAVVVNGVAGSGKTTIALHRIAYLLYNHRQKLENKVLILGPNNIFMEYISQVLPSLGETGVRQNTLYDFVQELLGTPLEVLPREDFLEAILGGDDDLYQDAKLKRSQEWIDHLKNAAKDLEKNLYEPRDFIFDGSLLMSRGEMEEILQKDFAYMPLTPRGLRFKRVLINRLRTERNRRVDEINQRWQTMAKDDHYTEGSRRDEIRELLQKVMAFRKEMIYLGKGDVLGLYQSRNPYPVLTHEDLIPILYFKHLLEGTRVGFDIKYLVIDEAQDYSRSNLAVLSEITGVKDATIVGDMNQRMINYDEPDFMDVKGIFPKVDTYELTRSYRSTTEIVHYADEFRNGYDSDSLRQGTPVEITKVTNGEELVAKVKKTYETMKENGLESIAILTRNIEDAQELDRLLRDELYYKFIRTADGIYSNHTLLLSAFLAKGLEFDGVILVDDEPQTQKPDLVKYIMATRALHELTVIEKNITR